MSKSSFANTVEGCQLAADGKSLEFLGVDGTVKFVCPMVPQLRATKDEGTITALAGVVVTDPDAAIYCYTVDTTAGDVDLSALAAVTGINDGEELIFKADGANNVLWNGCTFVGPNEDWLRLIWCADTGAYIPG